LNARASAVAGEAEWASYRRLPELGVEVMRAHFVSHVYERHAHDTYSFGVTETGVQVFRCRGATRASAAGMVMTLNPEDPHDGQAGSPYGFTYRMVHIDAGRVTDALAQAGARRAGAPLFRTPVAADPRLADRVGQLAAVALGGGPALEVDELLDVAVVDLTAGLAAHRTDPDPMRRAGRLDRAVDLLHDRYADPVTADELARAAGLSRFQLYRQFCRRYGLAPSTYQRQVRLRAARIGLAAGLPPAEVAAAVGFADQAHLTRWFRRAYGITPARYQRAGL
jgi:AraC-like DNA-binding protein